MLQQTRTSADANGLPAGVVSDEQQTSGARQPGGQSRPGALLPLPPNVASSLTLTLLRLEEVLDEETDALRNGGAIDLNGFNERKSQALLDLTRTLKHIQGGAEHPALAEHMKVVRLKLGENQTMLQRHLDAVREISTTISDAIQEADSDGTYSPSISMAGRG